MLLIDRSETVDITQAGFTPTYWLVGILHPAGRALDSDSAANSFIIVVYENFFSRALDTKFWLNLEKNCHDQPL